MIRGLQEELGLAEVDVGDVFIIDQDDCFVGEMEFVPGVLARVVRVICPNTEMLEEQMTCVDEVSFRGWEDYESLMSQFLRLGVRNVLSALPNDFSGHFQDALAGSYLPLTSENLRMIELRNKEAASQ